jgi:hypothetical protein
MCQSRKPHSQLLGEGGESKNSLKELALAQISGAVDIRLHLKNYLCLLEDQFTVYLFEKRQTYNESCSFAFLALKGYGAT